MGKIKSIINTGYNGGLGAEFPEGRKMFTEFIEICHVKVKNVTFFQKFQGIFARIWSKI